MKLILNVLLAAVTLLVTAAPAYAQDAKFPSKTVKIIVPFSAGTLTDVVARIYADKLTRQLGQSVIVDNRTGAGGTIGTQAMVTAPADGYTLLFVSSSHAINPALYANLPYDTMRDIAGVAIVASSPCVAVVNPELGAKTLKDFISIAKQRAGKMSFGSAGVGTGTHLVGEYLSSQAQINIVHVPYKGVQDAVLEVMAGRIEMAFPPIALALQQIRAGKIVGLAVTSAERSPMMPDVPTAQEAGLPGFDFNIWYAFVAPAKTPRPIIDQIAREIQQVATLPDVREKMLVQGLMPKSVLSRDLDAYIQTEIDKLGKLVKTSGAKSD